ncbi:MAG: ketose-bisphosphate aldolase [Spirochaetales bacterium]|nr:ketose-bisphosphate aldolase [Spirochaetales bacterium]
MALYQEIGFVNTREMFRRALAGGYAVPAYNFVTLEHAEAILRACRESRSPVILQLSRRAREYFDPVLVRHLIRGLGALARSGPDPMPVAMHLDHGQRLEECVAAIEDGYSSVMLDGSALPFDENVAATAEVVRYAHRHEVTVEGELGALAGAEEEVAHGRSVFTDPEQVEAFVARSGVDSLAVSVGNMHGLTKVAAEASRESGGRFEPALRLDLLEEIQRRLPEFPLVLHGASSVLGRYVTMINEHGGAVRDAVGIPEEQIRRAATMTVCKVNIASDGYLVMTATIRRILAEKPGTIDPRQYLGPAREELVGMYADKNRRLFGSAGRA